MNQQVSNPYGSTQPSTPMAAAATDQQKGIAEVQAAVLMAKKFPRNPQVAMDNILTSCTRRSLAENAIFTYARGGTDITGPSIRLAEAISQAWGNMQIGIRELEQSEGVSTMEAFAWDLETNTRQTKIFQVEHVRYTRSAGKKALVDPRDIYENNANMGARRLRSCILGLIPGDVIEAAVQQCEVTLASNQSIDKDAIDKMLKVFIRWGITKEHIEKRIQRRLDAVTAPLMVQLHKIANSLRDGMSKPEDWFEIEVVPETPQTEKQDGPISKEQIELLNRSVLSVAGKDEKLQQTLVRDICMEHKVGTLEELKADQIQTAMAFIQNYGIESE